MAAAVAGGALQMQAGTVVPDAAYSMSYLYGGWTAPGTQTVTGTYGDFTLNSSNIPQVSFSLAAISEEDVRSSETTFIEITGPASTLIPVNFHATLDYFTTIASQGQGAPQWALFTVGDGTPLITKIVGPGDANFDGVLSGNLLSNTVYAVEIEVSGNGANFDFLGNRVSNNISFGTASDYFGIDPNFANASDYTLSMSDGILNGPASAAAPEPASFTLIGLALCGAAFLRRKAKPRSRLT
jgi:hypothetical protein